MIKSDSPLLLLFALGLLLGAAIWPAAVAPSPNDLPPTYPFSPKMPASQVLIRQAEQDKRDGEAALRAKDYAAAEEYFRSSVASFPFGDAYSGLAEALMSQGHEKEARQIYRMLVIRDKQNVGGPYPTTRALLEYAVLLSQSKQWAEAISIYQYALPALPKNSQPKYIMAFHPNVPQPLQLETSAHIALGQNANYSYDAVGKRQSVLAFEEYGKALALVPDSPATNYFYGYGWQNLDPKDRAKLAAKPGQRDAVKAALEKAAKLGEGEVQTQAKKELGRLR